MRRAVVWGLLLASALTACETELTRRKEEELRQSKMELEQERKESERFRVARQKEEQRTQDCNRAFRSFENAQAAKDPRDAVALYRNGLNLCPDDDVARYELGKILAGMGRREEARGEFDAALKINPNFQGAKQELEKLQRK